VSILLCILLFGKMRNQMKEKCQIQLDKQPSRHDFPGAMIQEAKPYMQSFM
jgi:hypothetical protein